MGPANYALRFLLEMAALAALAYWGFADFDGATQWVAGLGAPLLMAVVWGTFMSPKASRPTVDPVRLVIELALFGSAVVALFAAGAEVLAAVLAVLAVVHLALTFALGQRPGRDGAAVSPS